MKVVGRAPPPVHRSPRALDGCRPEGVGWIRRSGLPEGAVDDAVKTATAPLRARIQHGLRAFDEAMDELGPAPGEQVSRSEIDAVQTLLIEQVLGPAAQLHETDPVQDDAVLVDRVAQALRHLSVLCFNELEECDRSLV